MSKPLAIYDPARLEQIKDVLTRAGAVLIDEKKLKAELELLVAQIGIATEDTRDGRLWREVAVYEATHAELAEQFRKAAKAKRPLSADVLPWDPRVRLSAMLRNRGSAHWNRERLKDESTLSPSVWDQLSSEDQVEVRNTLEYLSNCYRALRRRPRIERMDTALMWLGDIFLAATEKDLGQHELPYSPNSHFIQFAALALKPFEPHHANHKALSRRWERLVGKEREALAEMSRENEE